MSSPKILFACGQEIYEELVKVVTESFANEHKEAPIGFIAVCVDSAKTLLRTVPIDLLVVDLWLRKDLSSPLTEKDEEGLNLLEWLANNEFTTPSVLLLPDLSSSDMRRLRSRARQIARCFDVTKNGDLAEEFASAVRDHLDVSAKIRPPTIDIVLNIQGQMARRTYSISGLRDQVGSEKDLAIADDELKDILRDSEEAEVMQLRPSKLERIAEKLEDQFRNRKSDFWGDICAAIESARRDSANTRVRFVVDRTSYGALLEAIRFPRSRKYWMLEAPVFRSIESRVDAAKPLFAGETASWKKPINCLLIDGTIPASTFAIGNRSVRLDDLRHVKEEIDSIESQLNGLRSTHNIGRVQRIEPGRSQLTETKNLLESDGMEWHLVHYGGHSYFDDTPTEHDATGKGYVFLQDGDDVCPIEVAEFSQWLRRTNLVFLCSCKSSERGFVYELIENQVPAVCGFRWPVADDMAYFFAQEFYRSLFDQKSIDEAFYRTRLAAYKNYPKDSFWAAPMLVQRV